MNAACIADEDPISSTDYTDDPVTEISEVSTPVTFSADVSPHLSEQQLPLDSTTTTQKKKKKKKSKKSAKAKEAATASAPSKPQSPQGDGDPEDRPQVLCISRNKHWRYISSYHGPWLQLPIELLESLLLLNLDSTMYTVAPRPSYPLPTSPICPPSRFRAITHPDDHSPPESPHNMISSTIATSPTSGKPAPPPIDPGVLRSVTAIRRLIDEATELSVRASSGLSTVELGSIRNASSYNNGSSWATAQSLGLNPLGTTNGGGRNVNMSANRVHRLRALAVQKLAQAYRTDEIASSVMVMQGGSVFDDIAERVLKHDPSDADAKYVHFFHEKIPSSHRQLAESTTTTVLDTLISAYPHQLEYYRTRGIVHCFREEFIQAAKDFTYALKEARTQRRARITHHAALSESRGSKSKRRKGTGSGQSHTNGQAPSDGTAVPEGTFEGPDREIPPSHPSTLPDAPEPIETQLLFLRGASYLQHAVHLIESAIINLEGVQKPTSIDGADLRLCCLENGRYGGVEIGNPDGPLGSRAGAKMKAYRDVLGAKPFRDQINSLLKKSIRDHEKFLSHFDTGDAGALPDGDIATQVEYAFLLSESIRPGSHNNQPPPNLREIPPALTTYHPLLVESHFSVLICYLLLADFTNLLPQFAKTAILIDGIEGYPIFLPPRSMGQAEFIEVLERLATGWKNGIQPHSLTNSHRGKARLTNFMDLPRLIAPSISNSSTISTLGPPSGSVSPAALLANLSFTRSDLNTFPVSSTSSLSGPQALSPIPAGYITAAASPRPSSSSAFIDPIELPSSSSSTFLQPDSSQNLLPDYHSVTTASSASVSRKSSTNALNSPALPSSSLTSHQLGLSSKDKSKQSSHGDNTHQEFYRPDAGHALDCARILLAPVVKRQRERVELAVAERTAGIKKKAMPINIPLHGPRVEIILGWLGAVHLPELEG